MCLLTEDFEHDSLHEVFECSVEVLARIDQDCGVEVLKNCVENHSISLDFIWLVFDKFLSSIFIQVSPLQGHQGVWLPWQLRDQLLWEMETYILGSLVDKEIEKWPISNIFRKMCTIFKLHIWLMFHKLCVIFWCRTEAWMSFDTNAHIGSLGLKLDSWCRMFKAFNDINIMVLELLYFVFIGIWCWPLVFLRYACDVKSRIYAEERCRWLMT